MINIGVILASGSGSRYQSDIPKQWVKLNGKTVVLYTLDEMIKSNLFQEIIIVVNCLKYIDCIKPYIELYKNIHIVVGGKERSASVSEAIKFAKRFNPTNILFHDAVRPLIKSQDLEKYISALNDGYTAVITKEKITDSLYNVDRESTFLVQTPEAFYFNSLELRFDSRRNYTAIYSCLNDGLPCGLIKHVELNHPNFKLTYPQDLYLLEQFIKYTKYYHRVPNLKDKNVLLLGYSGGIGYAVFQKLLELQANVEAPSSKKINLNIKNNLISSASGQNDIIIGCAGVAEKDSDWLVDDNYERIININVRGSLEMIDYAKMLRKLHDRPINIVFVSSSSATKGREGLTVYSATKAALHSIVESQAGGLEKEKIYINCVCPEKVDTTLLYRLNKNANSEETLTPEEVATAILSYSDITEGGNIVHIRKGMNI